MQASGHDQRRLPVKATPVYMLITGQADSRIKA